MLKNSEEFVFKEEPKDEFTFDEAVNVVLIIDQGPAEILRLTPDNLGLVVEKGIKALQEERRNANVNMSDDRIGIGKVFEIFSNSSSQSHAIQCAVSAVEDCRAFKTALEKAQSKFLPEQEKASDAFRKISRFLERQIQMNQLLIELYKIDIARRYGLEKHDQKFFSQELPKLKDLIPEILKSLDRFKEDNKDKLEKDKETQEEIEQLRKKLEQENYDWGNYLYDHLCQPYSKLIFIDFENYNSIEIEKASKIIDEFT